MVDAYKKFWGNFGNFRGVTGRKDYWLASIANSLVLLAMAILLILVRYGSILSLIIVVITVLFSLIVLFGSLTMQVRRLRDAGFHWAWMFIGLLPYIGSVVSIVLVCMPTKQQPKTAEELEF
ncbi:DUF805 domain-containing protein [Enterococcus sp. AZ109]|uniref:DUF805 domain-containing protein n=1 Tax=Enterococcus sp. AZ109 TaxID=2774634 RepID=UPI003F1FD3C2